MYTIHWVVTDVFQPLLSAKLIPLFKLIFKDMQHSYRATSSLSYVVIYCFT